MEHYEIHYAQGDWAACIKIGAKMKIPAAELAQLSRTRNLEMIANDTHPWQGGRGTANAVSRNKRLVENGTHNFLGGGVQSKSAKNRIANGSHPFMTRQDGTNLATDRARAGTNPFQKQPDGTSVASKILAEGRHPCQKQWQCPCCNTTGTGASNFSRHHGNGDGKCLLRRVKVIKSPPP